MKIRVWYDDKVAKPRPGTYVCDLPEGIYYSDDDIYIKFGEQESCHSFLICVSNTADKGNVYNHDDEIPENLNKCLAGTSVNFTQE